MTAYLAGLAAGALVLAALGLVGGDGLLAARGDLAEIWAGSRAIVVGRDPYDPLTWTATLAELAARFTPVPVYVYPPYVALALVPLALLPLGTAAFVWTALGLTAAAVALGGAVRAFRVPPRAAFLFGIALFASGPAAATYAQGQWDFLLLAATLGAATLLRRFPLLSGLAAGALLAKPHLAPYAQAYDHLLLIAPLAIASGVAARRSVRRGELIAAAGVLVLVVLWTALYATVVERARDPYGALIPLGIFALVAGALWRQRREREP